MSERSVVAQARRWVVKIGSSLLTNDGRGLAEPAIAGWVKQMAALMEQGIEVVLVSSGSVAAGMHVLNWQQRPAELHELQVAAAVGQMDLIQTYDRLFSQHQIQAAQVLLTHPCLSDRQRYLNSRSALRSMLKLGVVPVVNENDTVVTDEIRFGDNDTLAALVANLVEAEVLVLLTDQDGLFDADPRSNPNARLISEAKAGDSYLQQVAGEGGALGRGGMVTKVRAGQVAARSGAHTVIVGGRTSDVLTRLQQGEALGTLLMPEQGPIAARKQWLAGHLQVCGELVLDAGAVKVLQTAGSSLLAVGVKAVRGDFRRGELISCVDERGRVVAHGLVNYPAQDASKIIGKPSDQIMSLLGYMEEPELVHRDNLVLL